ncbi:MAG: Lrp/AsnC family transcriptional regulator, partial [Nanoarchaeota archaeon]|nr:Lrp/AsnC family transcriptional regulator [Nanoarchaeota archaeon]MBU1604343.1 Lrp/AsnC family transcriptional regulator [Nanoarchaeota archaeon]MBU2443492.1 Lrp/AsnC family transcriptional regulator [Nanoarchaeota archaeon]
LDLRNKEILYELMKDCRQTSSSIGRKIRASREVVDYRIKKLEDNGFVKGYLTLVDTDKLGFTSYNTHLLLQNFTSERKQEIIDYLKNHPFVKWIAACSGKWDLIITVLSKDKFHFDTIITEIFTYMGNNLRDHYTSERVKIYKDADLLFVNPKAKISSHIEPERKVDAKIDEKDIVILEVMSKNARTNIIDIAKEVKLTPEATSHRIKNLTKKNIIRSFRAFIDTSKLDYLHHMLLLEVRNLTKEVESKMISFCNMNSNIFYVDKNISSYNIRMEIMSKDHEGFQELLEKIRNDFPEIKSYELLVMFKDYKQVSFVKGLKTFLLS